MGLDRTEFSGVSMKDGTGIRLFLHTYPSVFKGGSWDSWLNWVVIHADADS